MVKYLLTRLPRTMIILPFSISIRLKEGHTLVVSKKETDYIFDLSDELLAGMIVFAEKVAKAIGKSVPCKRVGVAVIGLEIPHAHIHLVPISKMSDMDFGKPKLRFSPEEFQKTAAKIKCSSLVSVSYLPEIRPGFFRIKSSQFFVVLVFHRILRLIIMTHCGSQTVGGIKGIGF